MKAHEVRALQHCMDTVEELKAALVDAHAQHQQACGAAAHNAAEAAARAQELEASRARGAQLEDAVQAMAEKHREMNAKYRRCAMLSTKPLIAQGWAASQILQHEQDHVQKVWGTLLKVLRTTYHHLIQRNLCCRGRWDVIEAKVEQQKHIMTADMERWMEATESALRGEYESRLQAAVAGTLAGRTAGAASAQQPHMA